MNPLVTVVIPTYNSAKYIRDSLGSVLAQTYPNIEIIVMDGASKDGTAEIARELAPNAIVISEPDRGQTHAINKGWAMAKGDIITWLCADDGYYPDTVATAVAYFNAHPDAMWVYGVIDYLDEQGQPSPVRVPDRNWNYQRLLVRGINIPQASTFLRRSLVEQKGPLNETLHYAMDYEYWLRLGRDTPGHWVPSIRATVKYYREAKSHAGQAKRLNEFKTLAMDYGAPDLPSQMRWEWVQAYFFEAWQHLRAGKFGQLLHDIREMFRYPLSLPRGLAKALFRAIIPPAFETRIRQLVMPAAPPHSPQSVQDTSGQV